METSRVITKRLLAKALSKELFGKKNQVDSRIKVNSLVKFGKLLRERMADVGTDVQDQFSPGFVSKKFLIYQELSENEEVKERLAKEIRKP